MKITILTPDFSHNCFGRAWLLAKLLQPDFNIEVIGPAFGEGIWKPLESLCDFKTVIFRGYPDGRFEFRRMLRHVAGDIIYASKPLMASFGLGLVKKFLDRKPLVLDIDDWELGFGETFYNSLIWFKKVNDFLLSMSNWRSYYYAMMLDRLIRLANDITVSGIALKERYGGSIIWHARDPDIFHPPSLDRGELRNKYLPGLDKCFIVGFIGTPRAHKGIEDLIGAMALLDERFFLLVIGLDEGEYCKSLVAKANDSKLKSRSTFLPEQPFTKLIDFLTITDLIVIPQRKRPASYGQVPAKIFDAMWMAKPIIATNVCDIPGIINSCGWIIEPENPKQLADAITHVFSHPDEALNLGLRAKKRYEAKFGWNLMKDRLISIFGKYEKY